jgi:hypothetical protein
MSDDSKAEADAQHVPSDEEKLDAICTVIREFHLALDMREHNAAASWAAISKVAAILDMPYRQGAEESRRRTGK